MNLSKILGYASLVAAFLTSMLTFASAIDPTLGVIVATVAAVLAAFTDQLPKFYEANGLKSRVTAVCLLLGSIVAALITGANVLAPEYAVYLIAFLGAITGFLGKLNQPVELKTLKANKLGAADLGGFDIGFVAKVAVSTILSQLSSKNPRVVAKFRPFAKQIFLNIKATYGDDPDFQ